MRWFKTCFGEGVNRTIQTRGGEDGADVNIPIFHIEAKSCKVIHWRRAMRQALRDSEITKKIPVVIGKYTDHGTAKHLAMLPLEELMSLITLAAAFPECHRLARKKSSVTYREHISKRDGVPGLGDGESDPGTDGEGDATKEGVEAGVSLSPEG